MSAEAKVNIAFDQIINGYPFDGSRTDVEQFFEGLTGFDAWLFQQFPKFRGQLQFSGSWLEVKDAAGSLFPELAKNPTGESVLAPPADASLTVEFHVKLPTGTNTAQIILQKGTSTEGFCAYLPANVSTTVADVKFSIYSGSTSMTTFANVTKGQFDQISFVFDRDNANSFVSHKNGIVQNASPVKNEIGELHIGTSDLLIGSGSAFTLFTPTNTFAGVLDELRIFHSARTIAQIQESVTKPLFATDDLKLYYRFNEPPPPIIGVGTEALNSIVLDSSGNSLHSVVLNFTGSLRQDAALDVTSRMTNEKLQTAPVLFTGYADLITLNAELLASASIYDAANPNLITKLIPEHYLFDGQAFEGFLTSNGNTSNPYTGAGLPGQGTKASVQLMLSFLYVYAKFFDELKLFVDAFRNLRHADYDSNDTVPNTFLMNAIRRFGLNLPPLFNDSTIEQYIHGENVDFDISTSEQPLKAVQSELMRRVLVNMPDIVASKGTQHSIKAFLNSIGIDPNNSMRFRESGGPNVRSLENVRETKIEPATMVNFLTSSLVTSQYLSGSRKEVGFPQPVGTFVSSPGNIHGVSNNVNDGLFTSGSWSVEQMVKWSKVHVNAMTSVTQSLCRVFVTGTNSGNGGLVANLLAVSSSTDPRLILYARPGTLATSPLFQLELPTDSIFDGSRWNVSFGVERNDAISSNVSSSYFLRAAMQTEGKIEKIFTASAFFHENLTGGSNIFHVRDTTMNKSGSFISIGENQTITAGAGGTFRFLNDTNVASAETRVTNFTGLTSQLRFWSKALSLSEWREHVRNYKSRGVYNPVVNFNYNITPTGSFEKLRMETLVKQQTRASANGVLSFIDTSENEISMNGTGFSISENIVRGEIIDYSYLSPVFDEGITSDKVRSRSYINDDLVLQDPWSQLAPVHEIVKSEEPTDDVKFAIEFSLVDALNRDIMTIFSTLDAIGNAIGAPELMFSIDYPELEKIRDVYFNRVKEKLNFRAFFEFYRWFDTTISVFIEQLIPRKTVFRGTNFVIEQHVLERHKIVHMNDDQYMIERNRNRLGDTLLLQQLVGVMRKW
jgi:hypothetical protein